MATTVYQSYFTSGPIPAYAPVEGTSNSSGDRHVLVYLEPATEAILRSTKCGKEFILTGHGPIPQTPSGRMWLRML
ncbi:MAG: hypothetical protein WDM87_05970 [Terracidiphilus sp.]